MNSNWSYGPETAKWGHDLCYLDLWPLTLTFCMDIASVNGNHSWKFHDDTMTGTLWKGVTDGRTDGQTDRKKCSKSCLVAANNTYWEAATLTRILGPDLSYKDPGCLSVRSLSVTKKPKSKPPPTSVEQCLFAVKLYVHCAIWRDTVV